MILHFPALAAALPAAPAEWRETPRLAGKVSGKQFLPVPELWVTAAIEGGLFAAGGDLTLAGASARALYLAGVSFPP